MCSMRTYSSNIYNRNVLVYQLRLYDKSLLNIVVGLRKRFFGVSPFTIPITWQWCCIGRYLLVHCFTMKMEMAKNRQNCHFSIVLLRADFFGHSHFGPIISRTTGDFKLKF